VVFFLLLLTDTLVMKPSFRHTGFVFPLNWNFDLTRMLPNIETSPSETQGRFTAYAHLLFV
jgi:hypothetical protein